MQRLDPRVCFSQALHFHGAGHLQLAKWRVEIAYASAWEMLQRAEVLQQAQPQSTWGLLQRPFVAVARPKVNGTSMPVPFSLLVLLN